MTIAIRLLLEACYLLVLGVLIIIALQAGTLIGKYLILPRLLS